MRSAVDGVPQTHMGRSHVTLIIFSVKEGKLFAV